MKNQFAFSKGRFIFTKGEYGYQQVLDSFSSAKEIYVTTYNAIGKNGHLISALKNVNHNCKIRLFTNIPGRWEKYYDNNARRKAQKNINQYKDVLNPDTFNADVSVFFSFSNHSKIVMTDSIAYIGSENYSESSSNNFEAGFVSDDLNLIDFIKNHVIPEMEKESVPYYSEYFELAGEASSLLNDYERLSSEFQADMYGDEGVHCYDTDIVRISKNLADDMYELVLDTCDISEDLYSAIDDESVSPLFKKIADDTMVHIRSISQQLTDMLFEGPIRELANFDSDEYVNHLLESEYDMEAVDEKLDDYITISLQDSDEKEQELIANANELVDLLCNLLNYYGLRLRNLLDCFVKTVAKKINPDIDNTED